MSRPRKILLWIAAILVVLAAAGWLITRPERSDHSVDQFTGRDPLLVDPKPESVPSIGIARPIGWAAGEAPTGAAGLQVSRFAEGLDHPRVLYTLPNGDVLVAEADAPAGNMGSGVTAKIGTWLMSRAGAHGSSPDTLVLLRDPGNTGHATERHVLRQGQGLESPSGLAWADDRLYVANHNAVLAFPYKLGETALSSTPKKLMDLPGGGNHWMRNLILSPDHKALYVAVGSGSNIADRGIEFEKGRAAIWQLDLKSGTARIYAQGMRNPNGMGWNPATGELWAVVNERDQLGPDLPPDYLTNVPIGAHYGWPWIYWKKFTDSRVTAAPPEYIDDFVRRPEYAMGPHVAPLGMAFITGGEKLGPQFTDGAVIARHGSWNRVPQSGYDVVFVAFDAHGNPQGKPIPLLTGFLTADQQTHGRPTWVTFAHDGALLVSDDTAGIIWRAINPTATPAAPIRPVVTAHMPPQRGLKGDPAAQYSADFTKGAAKVREQ